MTSTVRMDIGHMSCTHCAAAVERALNAAPGVKSAKVNLETGIATVEKYEDVSMEDLCRAVEEAGYTAKETSSLPDDD